MHERSGQAANNQKTWAVQNTKHDKARNKETGNLRKHSVMSITMKQEFVIVVSV